MQSVPRVFDEFDGFHEALLISMNTLGINTSMSNSNSRSKLEVLHY